MMQSTNWNYPTNIWVGEGRHKEITQAVRSHGRVWKYKGEAFVGDKRMADAQWSATIVDKNN